MLYCCCDLSQRKIKIALILLQHDCLYKKKTLKKSIRVTIVSLAKFIVGLTYKKQPEFYIAAMNQWKQKFFKVPFTFKLQTQNT